MHQLVRQGYLGRYRSVCPNLVGSGHYDYHIFTCVLLWSLSFGPRQLPQDDDHSHDHVGSQWWSEPDGSGETHNRVVGECVTTGF